MWYGAKRAGLNFNILTSGFLFHVPGVGNHHSNLTTSKKLNRRKINNSSWVQKKGEDREKTAASRTEETNRQIWRMQLLGAETQGEAAVGTSTQVGKLEL